MKKILLPVLALGAVALVITGCSSGSTTGASTQAAGPITIGASVSKTGAYASSSANVLAGYQLAIAAINKSGGVLGRKLELTVNDDQSDPGATVRAYTSLLTQQTPVDVLLSPYGSSLAQAAAQLAEKYKTPMVHSLTSSPAVFANSTYSVQAGVPAGTTDLLNVPTLAKKHSYTSIALVSSDLDAYESICTGTEAAAKRAGMKVALNTTYANATSDFSSVALKVKEAAAAVVVECSPTQSAIGLARAIDQQGAKPKMLVTEALEDPAYVSALGPLANKVVTYALWTPELDRTGNKQFVADYKAKYKGQEPVAQAADAYAAVQVLAAAIKKAGSTNHAAVNKALHTISTGTVLGTYKVDKNGNQTGYAKPDLMQLQGSKLELIYPTSVATAKAQLPY